MAKQLLLKVVVDRTKWYRGKDSQLSRLLLTEKTSVNTGSNEIKTKPAPEDVGKMCCLGFVCLAAGLTKENIANQGFPYNMLGKLSRADLPPLIQNLVHENYDDNSPECDHISTVNDDDSVTDEDREKFLKKLGADAGIEFSFIN